eukprot:m.56027 g.56027  ORF g.56027 m.56027 type:complete len:315 (+) comp11535_c0_seq3:146-1090(+)
MRKQFSQHCALHPCWHQGSSSSVCKQLSTHKMCNATTKRPFSFNDCTGSQDEQYCTFYSTAVCSLKYEALLHALPRPMYSSKDGEALLNTIIPDSAATQLHSRGDDGNTALGSAMDALRSRVSIAIDQIQEKVATMDTFLDNNVALHVERYLSTLEQLLPVPAIDSLVEIPTYAQHMQSIAAVAKHLQTPKQQSTSSRIVEETMVAASVKKSPRGRKRRQGRTTKQGQRVARKRVVSSTKRLGAVDSTSAHEDNPEPDLSDGTTDVESQLTDNNNSSFPPQEALADASDQEHEDQDLGDDDDDDDEDEFFTQLR